MMAPEPLKSAMTIGNAEDTSLALPSDTTLRSGQARVLNQVHTIKRSKSKHGRNGTISPSSPSSLTTLGLSEAGTFKFTPFKTNGMFTRSNSTMAPFNKSMHSQRSRTLSSKSIGGRFISSSGAMEQQTSPTNWPQTPNGLKPSRSDPALAPPLSVAPQSNGMRAKGQTASQQTKVIRHSTYPLINGGQMTNSQTRMGRPPSTQSNHESKTTKTRTEQKTIVTNGVNTSEMTLKEAVAFLSHSEENFQQRGATFIQHSTFKEDQAKQEVSQLGGIPPLVSLLQSANSGVNQAAAGALRNLVFKNQANKLEVQNCGGIGKALQLLKETNSTETQKQITGLLWNLSSSDELKKELIATALPVLTDNVVVPFTCWSDQTANNNIHPEVFYNATGCLRNLSCAQKSERDAMRTCPGLIDSLVSYTQSCVAEENPDDKSVENSTCILHNLTYQLEAEVRECFANYYPQETAQKKSPTTTGCFSPKSSKAQKEFSFDHKPDSAPSGVMWLSHPKTMQTYVSLLGSSQKDGTLEACCGALQNLTASRDVGSAAMSQIMVQKLGLLQYMAPLLKSSNQNLQKTAMSLLSNLSRTSWLRAPLAKQILPELASNLISGPRKMGNSDETTATVCNMMQSLISTDPEAGKRALSSELISAVADLSEDGSYPKGSKAAALLLYSLWNDKSLQGTLKKLGFTKALFVNENTTAVHKSNQVID
ncbi:plakophilin-1 [Periophthalmus magnuspinnatus]|uniref:plakophilin-1 n=1 Tax=Periophthalmus magnuspinnatus TaxID=409849 RepID=UPI00145B9079|nr:plakophilin-1 [Periophthalmus magnuspinnatus]